MLGFTPVETFMVYNFLWLNCNLLSGNEACISEVQPQSVERSTGATWQLQHGRVSASEHTRLFIDSTWSRLHKVTSEIQSKQKDADVPKLSLLLLLNQQGQKSASRLGNVLCTLHCFTVKMSRWSSADWKRQEGDTCSRYKPQSAIILERQMEKNKRKQKRDKGLHKDVQNPSEKH